MLLQTNRLFFPIGITSINYLSATLTSYTAVPSGSIFQLESLMTLDFMCGISGLSMTLAGCFKFWTKYLPQIAACYMLLEHQILVVFWALLEMRTLMES